MAPAKRKAPAGTTSNSTQPDGSPLQHEEASPRIEDITTEAVLHGDPVEDTENTEAQQTQSAELTEAALKLKTLEMKKRNIAGTGPGKQASRGLAQTSRNGGRS